MADHMGEVQALAIACIQGRPEGRANVDIAGLCGSILPAVWSFMLCISYMSAKWANCSGSRSTVG
jgi:hypothetical protein